MNLVHCQGSIYSGFYIYILADYSCLQRHSIYARLGSVGGRLPWNRGGRSLSRVTPAGNRCLASGNAQTRRSLEHCFCPEIYIDIFSDWKVMKTILIAGNQIFPEIVVSELKESSTIFPPIFFTIFVAFFKFPKL